MKKVYAIDIIENMTETYFAPKVRKTFLGRGFLLGRLKQNIYFKLPYSCFRLLFEKKLKFFHEKSLCYRYHRKYDGKLILPLKSEKVLGRDFLLPWVGQVS